MKVAMHEAEQLILLVKNEESLWNIHSEAFSNRIFKNEAWNRIARQMRSGWNEFTQNDKDKAIADLKKRWSNIKDYYVREKRLKHKHYSKRKSQYVQRRKYVFYDLLRFLDPIFGTAKRDDTEKAQISDSCETYKSFGTPPYEESNQILCGKHEDDTADYTIKQSQKSMNESSYCIIPQTPQSWQENPGPFMTVIPLLMKDAPAEHTTAQLSQERSGFDGINPNVAFLLSCAHEMEEMTPYQRIEFKSEVLNLLKMIKYPA